LANQDLFVSEFGLQVFLLDKTVQPTFLNSVQHVFPANALCIAILVL
jgi:hypothetical protein